MQTELELCGCCGVSVNTYPGRVNPVVIEAARSISPAKPQPCGSKHLVVLRVWAKSRCYRLDRRSAGDVFVASTVETVLQTRGNVISPAGSFLEDNPEPKDGIGVDGRVFPVAGAHKRGSRFAAIIIAESMCLLDGIGRTTASDRLDLESIRPNPIQYAVLAY